MGCFVFLHPMIKKLKSLNNKVNSKATHGKSPNPSLPEDIIYIILSRLPVKSLLRFRTVCRTWLSLISSRDFIRTHLSISTNDPRYIHHHLLFGHCAVHGEHRDLTTCSVYSLLNEPFTKRMLDKSGAQTFKLGQLCGNVTRVVGCCNGLVCLASDNNHVVFVWNPSIRQSRILPMIGQSRRLPIIQYGRSYAFCYDEPNDDFKVFAIFKRCRQDKYATAVYSLKFDSWKMIGDFPIVQGTLHSRGYFANGAIHWIIRRPYPESELAVNIVSLDVKSETCRELMQPKYEEGAVYLSVDLFGEKLMIITHGNVCSDFWVMNECGVEESWRKLFRMPYQKDVTRKAVMYCYPKPICIFSGGDILLNMYSTIALYNPQRNKFKDLLGFRLKELHAGTYVESLVSLHL